MQRITSSKLLSVLRGVFLVVSVFALVGMAQMTTGCDPKPPTGKENNTPTDGGDTCTKNEDCPAGFTCGEGKCKNAVCTSNDQCGAGKECKNGSCVASETKCTDDSGCPPGQTCQNGACAVDTGGSDPVKIEIVEKGGVLRQGQTKTFTARALNKAGATISGDFAFEWSSSNGDAVTIDKTKGVATGGSTDGESKITVKFKELVSEPVSVRNYAELAQGKARVIVVDNDQKGVNGATVKVADKEAKTDENGVAVIEGVTAPFDVHVFSQGHSYFSAIKVNKADLFVQLTPNPDNSKAGGVKGTFQFDKLQKMFNIPDDEWSDYAVGFGVAGVSLSENILDLDFDLLVGESFKVNLLGNDLSLPSGLVVALATGGKQEFQSLGEPGRRLLWGFGGKFKLDEVLPIVQGATGGSVDIGSILSKAKPLFKRMAFGYISDVDIKVYPRVADTDDKNGDGKTDDMIPDFSKFPDVKIDLNQPIDKPIPVTISAFPKVQHKGKDVDLLSIGIAGILLPGVGLIPLGLDVDQAKTSNKLEVKYTERKGILAKGTFALITLALNISSGDDAPPLMLFGDIKTSATPPSSHTVTSFLPMASGATYDPAGRKMENIKVDGATLFQVEITLKDGKKWLVVFDASAGGTVTLPKPPDGFDDRAASADSSSLRAVKLSDGKTMHSILEFNSVNMDRLVDVIAAFNSITIYEKK